MRKILPISDGGERCTIRIYIRLAWEKRFTRNNHIWQSFITSDNVYLFGPNSKTLFIYYIGLNSDYKKIQPKFWLQENSATGFETCKMKIVSGVEKKYIDNFW